MVVENPSALTAAVRELEDCQGRFTNSDERTVQTMALLQTLDNAVRERVATARAQAEALEVLRKAQQAMEKAQCDAAAAAEAYSNVRERLADILKQDKM